ncbi:MAG: D-2-hydroxyacid dehydrogenase [Halobacteriales archaeon]
MSERPTVLIPHHVPRDSAVAVREGIEARRPEIDLRLEHTPEGSRAAIDDAEIVVTFGFEGELLAGAERLEWIQALVAGVDRYDFDELEEREIALTNASGIHAEPIGEQVLGYMLAFERNLHTAVRQQDRGIWERFRGGELAGKTVGIVGLGAIGTRVAELAKAFDTTVIGTKANPEDAPDAVDEVFGPDGLHEVCQRSDYLVVACPLNEQTRGMIGRWEFRMMKGEAVLINVARGEVVDQDAMVYALQQHSIGGAALDVFETEPLPQDSPLWDLSNVIVTPHMSGSTPEYMDRCAELFVENYDRYLAGDSLKNRIV